MYITYFFALNDCNKLLIVNFLIILKFNWKLAIYKVKYYQYIERGGLTWVMK